MKIRFVRRSGNCLRLGLALWRYKGRPLAFLIQIGTRELQFNFRQKKHQRETDAQDAKEPPETTR